MLQSINGNGFSNSAGGWENEGNSTFARGRRGWVQYNFNIAAAGVYVIDVEIAERIDKTTPGSFQIAGYVDGAWSATRVVEVTHGTPQKLEFFLPKLAAGSHTPPSDGLAPNARQSLVLERALHELDALLADIAAGSPYDCCSVRLDAAAALLGEVTGLDSPEEVLNRVFSSFCIGK